MKIIVIISVVCAYLLPTCEKYEEDLTYEIQESERQILEETGINPACGKAYKGPEGNIQITSHCMTAYNYVCNSGYDPNSPEIQSVCNTYDQMREATESSLGSCPYCE